MNAPEKLDHATTRSPNRSGADTRAVPRLEEGLRARQRARRSARADARSGADQRRGDRAVRHLGAVHRPVGGDRRAQGPGAAARRAGSRHAATPRPTPAARRRPATTARSTKTREAERLAALRREAAGAATHAAPREGRRQRDADALRAARHRHARRWSSSRSARTASANGWPSTWPMRRARSACTATRWARRFRASSRPSSCATRWRAAARSSRPTSTIPKIEPMAIGRNFLRQDQRQHRQLGGHVEHRRRGRKAGVGDPLGRRQRDGPVHRHATSTPRATGSCATRRCRSARCRSTRRWRRSAAWPKT